MVRRKFGREPCLSDFATFVHEVYDPIFFKDAVLEYVQTPDKKKNNNKKKFGNVFKKRGEVVKGCLCEGHDDLDDCNSFLQFDLQERRKWLFQNNLCYLCLSVISVNHNARNCRHRKECKVCTKRHPASLRGYKAEKSKVKQPGGNSSEESKVNVNCATANTKSDVSSVFSTSTCTT